jgi:hypothetical protein
LKAVKKFINNEQWKDREAFNKLITAASKHFGISGAAISLVDDKRQVVKYQMSLNINECPRRVSIDSHTILSKGNFILCDTSKDWRTANNPFVKGAPFIRFYAGVPLVTKFGAAIGVFSIFGPFPRSNFDQNQITFLQELAEEVMTILSAPPLSNDSPPTNTMPLIKIIGRPTGQGTQFSPIAVYEKDGSGSQYSQNFNLRYNKQEYAANDFESLSSGGLIKQLTTTKDIKTAACRLSQNIATTYRFDMCCIVEIRVCQLYHIASEFFPQENSIEADRFKFAKCFVKAEEENVMSRLLGSYGFQPKVLNFDSSLYYSSLSSEFGVFYECASSSNVKFRAGIVMPFYRMDSKLVRKRKIIKNSKANKCDKSMIEVYLRSGGFLIAAFNENEREITDSEMNSIHGAACLFRRIFISN